MKSVYIHMRCVFVQVDAYICVVIITLNSVTITVVATSDIVYSL